MSDPTPPPSAPKKRRPAARKRKPAKKAASSVPADGAAPEAGVPDVAPTGDRAGPTKARTPAATAHASAPMASRRLPAPSVTPDAAPVPVDLIRVPLSVRWRDLDAFNHVNNSKYLSYLEEARLRWMMTMPGMGLDDDVAPVVAASHLNYCRPISWPGDVLIELFVERIGNTSVTIGHRIVDAVDGNVVYCDGNVVMVWIDRQTGRAAPLPDTVRGSCSNVARDRG